MDNFRPNEANAIDYRKSEGHSLEPHCDDRQLSGKILVNLCLCADAVMTYTRDRQKRNPNKVLAAVRPPETFFFC